MRVRILEPVNGYQRGEVDLPRRIAIDLISKGYAVVIKERETGTDKDAENALLSAKARDGFKE